MSGRFIVMQMNADGETYSLLGQSTQSYPDRPAAEQSAGELARRFKEESFAVFERVTAFRLVPTLAKLEDPR